MDFPSAEKGTQYSSSLIRRSSHVRDLVSIDDFAIVVSSA